MTEDAAKRHPTFAQDVGTVLWKELRELRQGSQASRFGRGGLTHALLMVAVFGILLPFSFGRDWVTSPTMLLYWAWVPMLIISSVVAQSFAGERELHTLESLLATRLSDRSILFGKIAACLVYGWGITISSLLLGLVVTNLRYWGEGPLLYAPAMAVAIVALTLLLSLMASSLGVLVSLRARTVRQAQQALSVATMVLVMGSMYGVQALPIDWASVVGTAGSGGIPGEAVLYACIGLLLLDAGLIVAASSRFQRARLITD